MKEVIHKATRRNAKKRLLMNFSFSFIVLLLILLNIRNQVLVSSQSIEKQIESAIYRQEEFFGSRAIVPISTAEAFENLSKLVDSNNLQVFQNLGELAEKLEKFDEAEKFLIKTENLEKLADFYHRRANFVSEAETLEKIFHTDKTIATFTELVELARIHEIEKYLQPDFFQQVADETNDSLPIIQDLIDKLVEDKNVTKALEIIRKFKAKFLEKMLEREIALLSPKEAEAIYHQAFNPFWTDTESEKFYQFLDNNNRFRAYGSELKTKFRQNPDDYQIAIRLIHYKQHDYGETTPIVLQLEKAKKIWQADELLTIARFLLKSGNGDLASKFLYTLHIRNDFTPEMRSKISYQIFKILCNAENEKLALTKGDLSFYRDVAAADTHPGITTGILSLIFSDSNPNQQLIEKERVATKFFNRAAIYKVFQTHKRDFPEAPELGQMYLDLIGIYTIAKDTDLAEKLLNEFEANYEKSSDFPRVAMNLAEAFIVAEKVEKERQIYQKVLDYFGKKSAFSNTQKSVKIDEVLNNSPRQNQKNYYQDLLANKSEQVTYETVLARFIASLSKEKKVAEILELYSNEIGKYPDQEWLYEQRLSWLDQTNMFAEQKKMYQTTLEKFPTAKWRDRIARRFIKEKQASDLELFSDDLLAKLNDSEAESYLEKTVGLQNLGEEMYLKLCEKAYQRFPNNLIFINRLMKFYKSKNRENDWRNFAAKYYFTFPSIRQEFFNELAKKGEIEQYLSQATGESVVYELFRADANLHLSRYEEALKSFRKLNAVYPNDEEFSKYLINLTRSFGQKERQNLSESAEFAQKRADFEMSNTVFRTESGEINAELGNYKLAKNEWQKLIENAKGSNETYLKTASVFWDYFQYDDALDAIEKLRLKSSNSTLYSYQAGAILESQHKQIPAISEYLKALENDTGKAQNRLIVLGKNGDVFAKINATIQSQTKSDWKTFRYAEVLRGLAKVEQANSLLRQQISLSKNVDFLESAKDFSAQVEPIALKRLADISINSRKAITYRLKLADFYRENRQPNEAQQTLANLVQKYPYNYGVLTESADFYWSLGANEAAIQVLQRGFKQAKGDYRFTFASRLAKRLISLNRLVEAEQFLTELHNENPTNTYVFHELASVYVHSGKADKLHDSFAQTIKAIKLQDVEPKEVDAEIATIREQMITAFTALKDYRSVVEQHIEIINREPENEENIDAAIDFVKRYGEADLLLNFYQKTADDAFKNYRWNMVLAQIYEANGDAENAVKNFHKAIDNQPEMTELYGELVRIETNRKNYGEALKNLDKIIELSGEEKNLLKQKVQLLQLLGRSEDAKVEQEKLPVDIKPIVKPENQFAEADKMKSVEMFREAFNLLLEKPLETELKGENITSYINTLRQEENLDVITERLFGLREIYVGESNKKNSNLAGEARNRLKILDNAMSQSVGNIAKTVGTNEELENLHENLSQRIDEVSKDEQNGTLTFLQDFSVRAGFGNLVEKVLVKRGNTQNLIDFYNERGAYQKILDIAETTNNLPLIAENAKLLGNREKELDALRQLYQDKNASQPNVSRFLQVADKTELEALAKQNSPHQLQFINFLLGKGEKELAHTAIENSKFQKVWKLSRHAETSLALKEFDERSECYFCDALNIGTIGELIMLQPDKTQQLIGEDWFLLSSQYGEWLDVKKLKAEKFLPAMTEYLPKDASEQAKLSEYYLAKNDLEKAREHFELSIELGNEDVESLANYGETLWRIDEKEKAEEVFEELLKKDIPIYLQTLQKLELHKQLVEKILPVLVQKDEDEEDLEELIYPIADTFDNESEKANYFLKLVDKLKNPKLVLQKIIQNQVIAKEFRQPFFERLLSEMEFESNDYQFEEISRRTFSNEVAEEIYDHEKDFAEAQRERFDKFTYQYDYLEFLLEMNKIAEAKKLVSQIENEMKGKIPRPISLRLIRFQLFGGNLQKIVGIEVTENIKLAKPPSIERLNETVAMLRKIKKDNEAEKLTLDFYARMLELEQFETANFIGLARQYFKLGDNEKAFQILKMFSETENFSDYKVVAVVCAEFGFLEKAIEFRQKSAEISPFDFENKFELAKLLPRENAIIILQSIVNQRNMPRSLRWQAILKLYEFGEISEIPNVSFDAYSQFYNGDFLNSLIADNAIQTQQLQQLIKFYATDEKSFAALKLSESDKSAKNDELLDLLVKSAEKVGEFEKAIEFEKSKTKIDEARIENLRSMEAIQNKRVTDFTVD
jgi:cellulose synthase operon protein C